MGVVRDRALWALHQAENQTLHPVGNKEVGHCFAQGKWIILERVEGCEIKVRETKEWLPLSRDDASLSEGTESWGGKGLHIGIQLCRVW